MFTDMVGYSALTQMDERRALEMLDAQRGLLRPILARHSGNEVKTIGDGFLVEFPSAVEAAQCAIEIQEAVTARNEQQPVERRFQVRIGLHIGDIVLADGDVFGDGVNIASRIEAFAPPGGIAMTEAVAQQVGNKLPLPVARIGPRKLKNIRDRVTLYRVTVPWDSEAVAIHRRQSRWWGRMPFERVAFGATALLLIGGLAWWVVSRQSSPAAAAEIRSLAVLPLDNLSNDPSQEFFVEGMHDALISELARIGALRIISRTSMMKYKDHGKAIPEISRELDVDAVVEGSVLRAANRVRITAQLIEASSDQHLWSRTYERDLKDVLSLQSEVAREIAREIRVKLAPPVQARLASTSSVDPEAYEAYLRGRWYRDQGSAEDLEKAFEFFQLALDEDPSYAPAYAGIATYYSVLPFYSSRSPVEVLPRAKEAAMKALELDENLPEAHAALAYIRAYYEWDWAGAARSFRRAIELSPSSSDAHFSYSRFLAAQGEIESALVEIGRAYELDPLSLLLKANTALLYYFEGDYERALTELQETLELDPEFPVARWGMALVYQQMGRHVEAIDILEKVAASPNMRSSLAHAYALAGRQSEAQAILDELGARSQEAYVPAYFFALIHAGLGDRDQAIEWLERAYQERSSVLAYLQVDPRIDNLRSDPRFHALLTRLRFPE